MDKTVNVTPTWMGLARIALDDLERSDLATRKFTIALLEDACTKLDKLNAVEEEACVCSVAEENHDLATTRADLLHEVVNYYMIHYGGTRKGAVRSIGQDLRGGGDILDPQEKLDFLGGKNGS